MLVQGLDWRNSELVQSVLRVPLTKTDSDVSDDEKRLLPTWHHIADAIANDAVPGVGYSLSRPLGRVTVTFAWLTVAGVDQRDVEIVKNHLDGLVRRANEKCAEQVKQMDRETEAQRRAQEAQAQQDEEASARLRALIEEESS